MYTLGVIQHAYLYNILVGMHQALLQELVADLQLRHLLSQRLAPRRTGARPCRVGRARRCLGRRRRRHLRSSRRLRRPRQRCPPRRRLRHRGIIICHRGRFRSHDRFVCSPDLRAANAAVGAPPLAAGCRPATHLSKRSARAYGHYLKHMYVYMYTYIHKFYMHTGMKKTTLSIAPVREWVRACAHARPLARTRVRARDPQRALCDHQPTNFI
jgi:hypothetical protein